MFGRIIGSLVAVGLYETAMILYSPVATIVTGESAGRQFDNTDSSFFGAAITISFSSRLGVWPALVLAAVLLLIWWEPIKRRFASRTTVAVLALLPGAAPASAYYDKTDFTEAYTILPNETAFWIPDAGVNKDNQAQFESEAYLNANNIPLKRFIVPHIKLQGSGGFFDFYVPSGRLIIVDRTPFR